MTKAEPPFGGTQIRRAWEPPEEVILQRAVVETAGLQPEDLGVLAALLLMDPRKPADAKTLAAELRAMGWKMSLDRFEVVAKRLTKAGHMSRESVYDPKTRRPAWVIEVYRNPANNRPYVAEGVNASSQVRAEIGENPAPTLGGPARTGENPISAGQNGIGENPGSGKTRDRNGPVSAGQGRNQGFPTSGSNPPHPPEEVTTSSPSPLTDTTGRVPATPGEEEGRVFAPEETAAAVRLLQVLPQPWSVGRVKAKGIAPALLEAMFDQGWPRITELDDRARRLLVEQLTKNPGGIKNHGSVLERDRVPNLPLFEIVAGAAIPAQGAAPRPSLPKEDPDFKPVPAPAQVADLLASLRKPNI
ncbi:hypothetical protein [Kitasatospora sp. MY 5-36]|uniref:hypothetical protein n=1 Tax=Kitasatospora sp. MY 5-36 TaxID=1678027 RepID=UPI0006710F63|nr:hypothetical protein [Kitasatospora sp. MY 5-36]